MGTKYTDQFQTLSAYVPHTLGVLATYCGIELFIFLTNLKDNVRWCVQERWSGRRCKDERPATVDATRSSLQLTGNTDTDLSFSLALLQRSLGLYAHVCVKARTERAKELN